ncbi:acetyltransferase, partial [Vibrio cholerae]
MNNRLIGVYGASGFGREVMPIIKQQFGDSASFVFIDDGSQYKEVNGYVVLNFEQFLN